VVNLRDMNICFVNRKLKPKHMITEIETHFPEYTDVRLVIARDLPSIGYASRIAKRLACAAYYESFETWTGYYVRNGKKVIPTYYRIYLSERRHIRHFKRVIVHSHTSLQHLIKLYHLVGNRTGVLYSALPNPKTEKRKSPLYTRLVRIKASDRIVICSGGLAPERGLEELIECFRFVRKQYKLVILGDGVLRGKLENQVAAKNLQDQVFFLPYAPVEKYLEILAGADIGIDFRIANNLNYDLACSVRVVDYLNCKLPVITSTTQGFKYIENQYGVVKCVPRQLSVAEKGAYIERLSDGYFEDLDNVIRQIKRVVETEFSFDTNVAKLKAWLQADGVLCD